MRSFAIKNLFASFSSPKTRHASSSSIVSASRKYVVPSVLRMAENVGPCVVAEAEGTDAHARPEEVENETFLVIDKAKFSLESPDADS